MDKVRSRVKGAVLGMMLGDALGYPFSDKKVSAHKVDFRVGPDGEVPGTYQGSSALALCTMASINDCHGIMPDDIVERFNDFLIGGYLGASEDCSDLSEVTIAAIKNYNNGMPPDKCGIKEGNDNECLARILPVALECAGDSIHVMIDRVHSVCTITHAEAISEVTCALYALIIRTVLKEQPGKVFDLLRDYYENNHMENHVQALNDLKSWRNGDRIVRDSTGSRNVADCFWSAWAAYSKFEDDFAGCLKAVISLGNDANANAAVAGGLSGLANGFEAIPDTWLRTVLLSSEVVSVIESFVNRVVVKLNI